MRSENLVFSVTSVRDNVLGIKSTIFLSVHLLGFKICSIIVQ